MNAGIDFDLGWDLSFKIQEKVSKDFKQILDDIINKRIEEPENLQEYFIEHYNKIFPDFNTAIDNWDNNSIRFKFTHKQTGFIVTSTINLKKKSN